MLSWGRRTRWIVGLAATAAYVVFAEWSRWSFVDPAPKGKVVIQLFRPFAMYGKVAAINSLAINQLREFADDDDANDCRSPVAIYENGRPLGPHSSYSNIRDYGMGRFFFGRRQGFLFTASDNSDPNTNGRTYWAVLAYATPGALTQENQLMGKVIKIDQDNGKITLEHEKGGTVGGCVAEKFIDTYNIGDGLTFSALKVGDPVVFIEAQISGVWTVTKIQKQ